MGETAADGTGDVAGAGSEPPQDASGSPVYDGRLLAAFTGLGVCVIGTHDPRRAAAAWHDFMQHRHAADDAGETSADVELDAAAWWHAQHRWARLGSRGWELVRDRQDDAEPAMVLVGVYRE